MRRTVEVLRSLDWILLGSSLLLVGVGLAMLFSSTETAFVLSSRFVRQLLALGLALIVTFLLVRIPYHVVQRYAVALYLLGIVGLLVVVTAGRVIRGTTSRLELAGFQLQPSEFMQVALIIALAWLFSRFEELNLKSFWSSAVVVSLPIILILLEPDLGVAALMLAVWVVMLIFLKLPWRALLALVGTGLVAGLAAWQWFLEDYQRERLLVFLDPASDPLGAGYNVVQSLIAFGSGKLWGRGLGQGPQSQLEFLPERHTDFILASVGEELGFLGVSVVLILFAVVLWRTLRIARQTPDLFGQLIVVGTFSLLLISLIITAGMNIGLLPVTGLPLPFLSYGGSNLVSTFVLLALVQSVKVHSKWVQPAPTEISHFT